MRAIWKAALLAAICAVAASCAAPTHLTSRWADPAYQGQPGQKILVVALTDNERRQYTWEGAFSNAIKGQGAEMIPGSQVFPKDTEMQEADLKQKVKDSGASLVAVTRLLAIDKEKEYVPGTTTYVQGYYGYYHYGYGVVHTPGYIQENTIVKLETNVYDVSNEKLVWSGVTETLNPESGQDAANSIAMAIVDDLASSKIIRKK